MVKLSSTIREALGYSNISYWDKLLRDKYGLDVTFDSGCHDQVMLARQLYLILSPIPTQLIRDCLVRKVLFRSDLGENRKYSPNHGYFDCRDLIALNADCFYHPDQNDDFMDHNGYFVNRGQQTTIHEWGHAYDKALGEPSLKPEWCALSGWSEQPKPGLKRLLISEPGQPTVLGEWYYDPKAEFTRFYAKRNCYDDFADSFSYYVAGLRSKVPQTKREYLDKLLAKYY